MKISQTTLDILKNFTLINPSILFREGSVIRTKNIHNTIMGEATVAETFPKEFGIYDLSQFLGALSLFSEPELEFGESSVKVSSGKSSMNYVYASASLIISPTKGINPPSNDVEIKITADVLHKLTKAANILQMKEVALVGNGQTVFFKSYNSEAKNSITNDFSVEVGESSKVFTVILKLESVLKMLVKDYDLVISAPGTALPAISKFTSGDVSYVIAVDASSTFN